MVSFHESQGDQHGLLYFYTRKVTYFQPLKLQDWSYFTDDPLMTLMGSHLITNVIDVIDKRVDGRKLELLNQFLPSFITESISSLLHYHHSVIKERVGGRKLTSLGKISNYFFNFLESV